MSAGLFLLFFLVAFLFLVYWVRKNDKLPPDQPTVGFLRMSFYDKDAAAEKTGTPTATQPTANQPFGNASRSERP